MNRSEKNPWPHPTPSPVFGEDPPPARPFARSTRNSARLVGLLGLPRAQARGVGRSDTRRARGARGLRRLRLPVLRTEGPRKASPGENQKPTPRWLSAPRRTDLFSTFSGLNTENPSVGEKGKVLTSKQNATNFNSSGGQLPFARLLALLSFHLVRVTFWCWLAVCSSPLDKDFRPAPLHLWKCKSWRWMEQKSTKSTKCLNKCHIDRMYVVWDGTCSL